MYAISFVCPPWVGRCLFVCVCVCVCVCVFAHRGQVGVGDVDGHGSRHVASHHQQQGGRLQHLGGEINKTASGKLEERESVQKTSSIPLVELPSSFLSLKQTAQVKTLCNQKSHWTPTGLMTKPRTKAIAKKV